MSAAAVILAHDNPRHVRRLIGALGGLDIFLHVDGRTAPSMVDAMVAGAPHVGLVPRVGSSRGSWTVVEAELAGLRYALDRSDAEHIVLLSGSCYPLMSVERLLDELTAWRVRSRFELHPIPYPGWGAMPFLPGYRSPGGLWRFNRRFLTIRGHMLRLRGMPVPIGLKTIPPQLALQASSQWKIYAREHARKLLEVLDEHPELVRYWRTAFVPEESCIASILSSPELVGSIAEQLSPDEVWYIDWRGTRLGGHPRWLDYTDFESLRLARMPINANPDVFGGGGKLFARKINPDAEDLLDRIDAELRS